MRIAFITTQINLKTGGGSNLSPHLKAASMAERGHNVSIITLFSEKNSFLETIPYSVIEISTKIKNWLALQIKIFSVLTKYQKEFDIFSFEGEHFIWGAGFYRTFGGHTPVVLHFNGPIFSIYEHGSTYNQAKPLQKKIKTRVSNFLRNSFEKYIGTRLANGIDYFTADSPLIKEWHVKFGFDPQKIKVLPAFVDLLFFYNYSEHNKKPDDKIYLIYVGRLVEEKGVDSLISAIREMGGGKLHLWIVGDGPEKEKLKKQAIEHGLQTVVEFLPWSPKNVLNKLYHSADIFVHPARWAEPLGLTVLEAMASGLPVIVPEISGSSWIADGAGLTFKNGDVIDLSYKIKKLVTDKQTRDNLASMASPRAQKFDYRNSILELEQVFYSKLGNKK